MAYDADEMPRASQRSIPPIARPTIPPPPPEKSAWSWVWAVGALTLACGVAIGAPQLRLWTQRSYGAGAETTEPLDQGPGLHTELVRDAPLHRMAEPLHERSNVAV